jgi:hypothetical protein
LQKGAHNDVELLALSIDAPDLLQKMIDRISADGVKPSYTFLSDPGHRVINRYGLLNADDKRGIPHPTTFVIDKDGVVRWKFIEINYKIRPTNAMILEAVARVERGLPFAPDGSRSGSRRRQRSPVSPGAKAGSSLRDSKRARSTRNRRFERWTTIAASRSF